MVGGKPVLFRKLVGHVDNSSYPLINVDIEAELTTPEGAKGVPVIVEFFPFELRGAFPGAALADLAGAGDRAGLGVRHPLDRAPSRPTTAPASRSGIIGLVNKGQPRKPDDWGALRAWAWGASRLLDYLETDPEVDAKRAVIEGVSRFGKASLVTMAYEPRFAIGFIGSSGMGGAALHRGASARCSRTSRAAASTTGWPATTSSTPGPLTAEGSAGRCARVDCARGAAAAVHRRGHSRAGRRLGGSARHVHGRRWRRARCIAC